MMGVHPSKFFDWTDESLERLKALWAEGCSAGQIADLMQGPSRNAVIGKVHRLGLMRTREKPAPKPAPQRAKASVEQHRADTRALNAARKVRQQVPSAPPPPVPEPEPVAPPVVVPITCEPVTLKDLEIHHCRWPLGDVGTTGFRFCGAPRRDQFNSMDWYCAPHRAVAGGKGTPSERLASHVSEIREHVA